MVDGLRLLRRLDPGGAGIPWGPGGLPTQAANAQEFAAIGEELSTLADWFDALRDAILADSVYHLVQGSGERAIGGLDAVSRGDAPPPTLEVAKTPRTGIGVTHRVMVLFEGEAAAAAWATPAVGGFRASVEPNLDAWAASLLPPPASVSCAVDYLDRDGAVGTPSTVQLSDLDLTPLDLVAIAVADDEPQLAELERRIIYRALQADLRGSLPPDRQYACATPSRGRAGFAFRMRASSRRGLRALSGARPLNAERRSTAGRECPLGCRSHHAPRACEHGRDGIEDDEDGAREGAPARRDRGSRSSGQRCSRQLHSE